jgi:DNA polymerase III sliding clamp (beta) subunit (PCNA family)
MHTTTNARTLTDALAVLKRYAGSGRTALPSAQWTELRVPDGGGVLVLRRWATKTGTDVSASIAADGGTAGSVLVNAEALAAALKGTKGTVTLTVTEGEGIVGRLTVLTGSGSAELRAEDPDKFPAPSAFVLRPFATIADRERAALRGVLAAAARGGDARAVLTGVYFDSANGEAVATDTYRMAAARIATMHASGIIPSDVLAIAIATGTGSTEVHADPDGERFLLTFRTEKGTKNAPRIVAVSVYGRFVPGPFPNYAAIVAPARDESAYEWTVTDAAGTADAMRTFTNGRNVPVMLEAAGSAVRASVTIPDGGGTREAFPPIVTDGKDEALAVAAFNPSYFADAAQHAGDGAALRIRDGLKAAYFDGGDRYALLMPMRVN